MKRKTWIGLLVLAVVLVTNVTPLSAPTCDVCSDSCDGDCEYIGWIDYNDCSCGLCMDDLDLHCQGRCDKYWCCHWFWECWAIQWETAKCDFCCD